MASPGAYRPTAQLHISQDAQAVLRLLAASSGMTLEAYCNHALEQLATDVREAMEQRGEYPPPIRAGYLHTARSNWKTQ